MEVNLERVLWILEEYRVKYLRQGRYTSSIVLQQAIERIKALGEDEDGSNEEPGVLPLDD